MQFKLFLLLAIAPLLALGTPAPEGSEKINKINKINKLSKINKLNKIIKLNIVSLNLSLKKS